MPKKKEEKKDIKNLKEPKKIHPYKLSEQDEMINFVALPRTLRKKEYGFGNLGELAERLKVGSGTFSEWLKDKEVQERIKDKWKQWGKEKTPNVIQSLYKTAVKEGKASEVKAWMQIIEDWLEKSEHNIPQLEGLKELADSIKKLAGE